MKKLIKLLSLQLIMLGTLSSCSTHSLEVWPSKKKKGKNTERQNNNRFQNRTQRQNNNFPNTGAPTGTLSSEEEKGIAEQGYSLGLSQDNELLLRKGGEEFPLKRDEAGNAHIKKPKNSLFGGTKTVYAVPDEKDRKVNVALNKEGIGFLVKVKKNKEGDKKGDGYHAYHQSEEPDEYDYERLDFKEEDVMTITNSERANYNKTAYSEHTEREEKAMMEVANKAKPLVSGIRLMHGDFTPDNAVDVAQLGYSTYKFAKDVNRGLRKGKSKKMKKDQKELDGKDNHLISTAKTKRQKKKGDKFTLAHGAD